MPKGMPSMVPSLSFPALMRTQLTLIAAGLFLAAPGTALAQGADECSGAPTINGFGTFSFNTSSATDSGPSACGGLGRDVWFQWVAPSTDTAELSTCSLASFDTAIAAYSGSCGSLSLLSCNDDACDNLRSRVSFPTTAGATYYLRIGSYNGNSGGSGQFELAMAPPSSCSNPASGPDVIVGEIPNISNFGSTGGMAGYSLGTTSCNVGTQELLWIANNNQHPVIGQNIYRAENGRFEQVGISWLKHGFTALQQNLCCSCNSSGTGTRLGVGCSDPYSSGLNGSQGGLGPRFQVNAFTGSFLYPFAQQGQSGDRVFKRIQVANDDVDPSLHPTASYFGEAQYISPDDSLAGNGFNNVSWTPLSRPGSTTNGAFRLSIGGSTVREEAAINAWATVDAGVTLADINVSGEGQFVAGSNVIDNGDGTWRYEYAVFNNNSDLSGQSFSIPTGNANVTNVGMSFPLYHSGEPYTNTPWTGTVAGGSVTWETETHAQNSNANALRWGTMYSFWFTANVAPTTVTATLGLFKPGNPGAQSVALDGPDAGGLIVQNYCVATMNSASLVTQLGASNFDLPGRSFDLDVSDMPLNKFGFIVTGLNSAFVPNAGGSAGNLCIGLPIGRGVSNVIFNSGLTGTSTITVDMDVIPTPGAPTTIMAGETRYFQAWHRDVTMSGGASSNFSRGLRITFP